MTKDTRGFSRTETLIVVVLLALIIAVVIASVSGWIAKANRTECLNDAYALRRSYAAGAAYHEYAVEEGDRATILEWASSDADVTVLSDTSYTGPCGGECEITYSPDNASIEKIVCSNHGALLDFSGEAGDKQ